jgi:hypothetical protein
MVSPPGNDPSRCGSDGLRHVAGQDHLIDFVSLVSRPGHSAHLDLLFVRKLKLAAAPLPHPLQRQLPPPLPSLSLPDLGAPLIDVVGIAGLLFVVWGVFWVGHCGASCLAVWVAVIGGVGAEFY